MKIFQASPAQVVELIPAMPLDERGALVSAIKISTPLLVGMDTEPRFLVGFIPLTMISEEAYLWMWPKAMEQKTSFGRHSIDIIQRGLEAYTSLRGHCFTASARRWLQWLGAEIYGTEFIFRRPA